MSKKKLKKKESGLNWKNVTMIASLAVLMLAIIQGAFAQRLTHKEKVDIQYQLNGIASVASGDAVEIEYVEESDVVKDAQIKEAYKNAYKKFEGKTAPSDNVELLNYIEYGNKTGNTVEVTISLNGELNNYTVYSKYNLSTRKFEDAENIFLYMCIAKNEYWETPAIINIEEGTSQKTVIQNETVAEQSSESTDGVTQDDSNSVAKDENNALTYSFIALFVLLLATYIVAIVRTRAGKMYTFANWWDFIILLVAGLGLSLGLSYVIQGNATAIHWVMLSVGILAFAGSLFMSIKINNSNGLNIALSIGAKLFIFIIVALIVIVWILGHLRKSLGNANLKNPNSNTTVYQDLDDIEKGEKMKKMAGSLAGILLVSLIAVQWEIPQPIIVK